MSPARVPAPFAFGDAGLDVSFAVRLPRADGAASIARQAVNKHLGDLLAEVALGDTLLVVSELVTNAVLDGNGDIELRIAFDGQRVTGDVIDEGIRFSPQPRTHGSCHAAGDGISLMGSIADSWGLQEGSNHVWFEILADRQPLGVG